MVKIKNFSAFMKLNESKGIANKLGSIKLPNGKTINMFNAEVTDKDTKKTVFEPSFNVDGQDNTFTIFYGNGKVKSGLLQQTDKNKMMSALGARTSLEYNDFIASITKAFKEKGFTVSIQKMN